MSATDLGLDLSRYKLGWSDEEDYVYKPTKGIDENVIREMSWMKGEPDWMRDFRLWEFRLPHDNAACYAGWICPFEVPPLDAVRAEGGY